MNANEIVKMFNNTNAPITDAYQTKQYQAARTMQAEQMGEWEYVTQWENGVCLFRNADASETVAATLHATTLSGLRFHQRGELGIVRRGVRL